MSLKNRLRLIASLTALGMFAVCFFSWGTADRAAHAAGAREIVQFEQTSKHEWTKLPAQPGTVESWQDAESYGLVLVWVTLTGQTSQIGVYTTPRDFARKAGAPTLVYQYPEGADTKYDRTHAGHYLADAHNRADTPWHAATAEWAAFGPPSTTWYLLTNLWWALLLVLTAGGVVAIGYIGGARRKPRLTVVADSGSHQQVGAA